MKKHKGHGKIARHAHLKSKKKDGQADASHSKHNKMHGTPMGFAPDEGYKHGEHKGYQNNEKHC